jgi:cephalosporin-C deacetylase-like acetyl esterase
MFSPKMTLARHLLFLTLFFASFVCFAQTNCQNPVVPPNNPTPFQLWAGSDKTMYEEDEVIEFRVSSGTTGTVNYTIRKDRYTPVLQSGSISVQSGQTSTLNYQLGHPGFLLFNVTQGNQTYTTGIGVAACDIQPADTVMPDFDEFWDDLKDELAVVPINPQLTYRADRSDWNQQTYKLELDNIDGKKVHGWVSIPNCPNPLPAILKLPAFGNQTVGPFFWTAKKGAIVVSISIHDYDPEQWVPDHIAYQPSCYFDDRDQNYYKWAILGAIRAIDYIETLPQFNGTDIGVSGKSQGGGLAIIVAGLDGRVKALSQSQAALSDHEGLLSERSSGFPYWIRDTVCSTRSLQEIKEAMSYYSVPTFAARYSGPSLNAVGYIDEICPPSSVFSAYNTLPGEKTMIHGIDKGHNGVNLEYDAAEDQFFISRFGMIDHPTCLSLLPLDLLSFKGHAGDLENHLEWTTENEVNTDFFQIERSESGTGFESIGQLKTNNSPGVHAYSFLDVKPKAKAYYRLKMVDLDGSFSYSNMIYLENDQAIKKKIEVFPNPFNDQLFFRASETIDTPVQILIYNMQGLIVEQVEWTAEHQFALTLVQLSPGIYAYRIKTKSGEQWGKVIHN